MKIGVISDTHNFLDPKVHELFAGVNHILHAGDIGNATIISELEAIAPVTAVYGNTDMGLPFKETEIIELGTRKFLIHHIVNPHALASVSRSASRGRSRRRSSSATRTGRFARPSAACSISIPARRASRSSAWAAPWPFCTVTRRKSATSSFRSDF